jgi:regulatory protein
MQISAITQAKRNLDHVNIFLDGQFWVNISKDELVRFRLAKDQEISEEFKAEIEKSSHFNKLIEKVYNYQGMRPHSIAEIKTYLTMKRKVDPETTAQIIELLISKGVLSDKDFARWYINNRLASGVHGPNKINAELQKKGVERKIIEVELKRQTADKEEADPKLIAYIEKIKRQIKANDKFEFERKLIQRLMGRGYGYTAIKKLIKPSASEFDTD